MGNRAHVTDVHLQSVHFSFYSVDLTPVTYSTSPVIQ